MQRIIFFDGICPLCNRFVKFVFKNDKNKYFKFASLQSKYALETLSKQDLSLDTIVYSENKNIYIKSTAVLRILFQLNGLWTILSLVFSIVPAPIRDYVYEKIASNRYKIFGQLDQCSIPTAEEKEYFLD